MIVMEVIPSDELNAGDGVSTTIVGGDNPVGNSTKS